MSWWNTLDDQRIREELERIEQNLPCEQQRCELARYHRRRRALQIKGCTLGTQAKIMAQFAEYLGPRSFRDACEEDLEVFFDQLPMAEMPATRYHKWVAIRGFYRDLVGDDRPSQLGRFKVKRPGMSDLQPSDLVSEDDFDRILGVAQNNMERAMLWLLYDVGYRNGELRALNTGSVRFQGGDVLIDLPADASTLKTGRRQCLVGHAAPALVIWWMENSQGTTGPKDPLFWYHGKDGKRKRIDANTIQYLMTRINREAGLQQRVWCHLFRHTAATNMARRGLQESSMRRHFGWSRMSDMPAYYTHLAEDDYLNRVRAAYARL